MTIIFSEIKVSSTILGNHALRQSSEDLEIYLELFKKLESRQSNNPCIHRRNHMYKTKHRIMDTGKYILVQRKKSNEKRIELDLNSDKCRISPQRTHGLW